MIGCCNFNKLDGKNVCRFVIVNSCTMESIVNVVVNGKKGNCSEMARVLTNMTVAFNGVHHFKNPKLLYLSTFSNDQLKINNTWELEWYTSHETTKKTIQKRNYNKHVQNTRIEHDFPLVIK